MTCVYVHHIPSAPLNAHVDGLFYLNGPMPLIRMKMLPMPTIQLLVNFGGAVSQFESGQADPVAACTESWWVGLWDRHHIDECPPDARFFGVRFKPGGAYPFLGLPLV